MNSKTILKTSVIVVVCLTLGFFAGMEYKAYQIRSVVQETVGEISDILNKPSEQRAKEEARNRDLVRISDVKNIKLALEFYWINNDSQYPEYLVDVLFDDFATEVLNELPIYPIPYIDSECSALGRYEYQRGENEESYTLSFCLETDVGEADGYYKKGENVITF